jgi:hypothetical protein
MLKSHKKGTKVEKKNRGGDEPIQVIIDVHIEMSQ